MRGAPGDRRRSAGAAIARGTPRDARAWSCHGLRSQRREVCLNIIAARMPQSEAERMREPFGDGKRGGGVLVQQKLAHPPIAEVCRVHEIDQFAWHCMCGLGQGNESIHCLRELRGTAWTMAHLTRD